MERLFREICADPDRFREFAPPARRHFSRDFPYAVIFLNQPESARLHLDPRRDPYEAPSRLLARAAWSPSVTPRMVQSKILDRRKGVLSESCKRATDLILPLVHGLEDEELLERLGSYGLQFERNDLRQWSATDGSAEEMLRRLIAGPHQRALRDEQLVWVWVAIQVLWERWLPETPSFEMLDECIAVGYDGYDRREFAVVAQ